MIKKTAALAAFTVLAVTGGTYAAEADAAPLPYIPVDAQLHARLAVVAADRPDAVVLAEQVCAILRAEPGPAGKAAARAHLVAAGVPQGFGEGWTLGTAADLYCPEMVGVLR